MPDISEPKNSEGTTPIPVAAGNGQSGYSDSQVTKKISFVESSSADASSQNTAQIRIDENTAGIEIIEALSDHSKKLPPADGSAVETAVPADNAVEMVIGPDGEVESSEEKYPESADEPGDEDAYSKRQKHLWKGPLRKRAAHSPENLGSSAQSFETGRGYMEPIDSSALERPQKLPISVRLVLILFIIVACIIGIIFLSGYFQTTIVDPEIEAQTLEENLTRESPLNLPVLSDFVHMDNATIQQTLTDEGDTLYNATSDDEAEENEMTLIRIPSDMTLDQAILLYLQGVNNLSASDAALLLNGLWTLDVTQGDYSANMSLHYADFTSGSTDEALNNAIASQNIDVSQITETGVDDAGNTYAKGTIYLDDGTYNWRVSVIELSEVYDIEEFPDDAQYVGIRLTS
ncbi:MAG: hypothetical protein LUB61_02095 [Eggerthellaceae bacterium]|nr:hypothetical protein [Eggerthellaceae bacterium]